MKRPVSTNTYFMPGRFGPAKSFIVFIGFLILSTTLSAQVNYTWNGSNGVNWNTPYNWTPNGVPGSADNVTIVTGSNNCQLNNNVTVATLKITSGTLDLGGLTLTVTGATASFSTGAVQNGNFISTAGATTFGNGPFTMNCNVNINSGTVTMKNTTFQKPVTITKNGTSNDNSGGGNTFNDALTVNATGSGYFLMGNGSPDIFNGTTIFNNTGGNNFYVAYNSAGNIFNGVTTFNNATSTNNNIQISQNSSTSTFNNNIILTCTAGNGIYFGGGASSSATLTGTNTISVGTAGFTTGTLQLRQFAQTGATAQSIALTGTGNLTFGPSAAFTGDVTCSSPTLYLNGCNFNGATNITKTGTTGDYSTGGNIFNGLCTITNTGSSYFLLGNNYPDTWNSDVTFTDIGSERILPCWASAGNQFNGNIYVNTSGSAQGIQFCGGNNTATATLAATKTIQAGSAGLTAGYLYLKQFTQLGSTPVNLTGTGNTVLYLGPNSNFGGTFTATAPDIWAQGATYNSPATFNKTGGSSNHNSQNQNIFNSTCTINQQSSSGYFMLGYNSNDLFNDNVIVSCTGTGGIYLGWSSGTGTPTMAAGKTILVGAGGFSAGFLYLNTFTQLGNTPMNLNFTGTNTYLALARGSSIGGDLTSNTPDIYFNGATFNGQVNSTKTGSSNDYNSGGNTFQGPVTLNNTGAAYWALGNGLADTCNNDLSLNSSGSGYIAMGWNSANNIFNGNINVSSSNASNGIYFCNNAISTAIQAAGKTLQIGAGGFSTGTLYLRQFTQLGNTPVNLTLTGANTLLQSGPLSTFGGSFTVTSPRILLTTTHYGDVVSLTKTGATGEWSYGGNTFNSDLTVNHQGAGYFGFANNAADTVNGDLYVNNNSTERVIFGSNGSNIYNGNIILTQIGSSQGIAFGWSAAASETQTAGKGISIGSAGFTTGWLQIERFTQLGNSPVSLPLPGNCSLTFGPSSTIGGDMTCTSGTLLFNGCTFNGQVNATKTGATNDGSNGNNIFNGPATMTNAGSGYLLFGSNNPDQFNSTSTFNNTGSSNLYVAYNSSNNIFGGVATFNNNPTANTTLYVSPNSSGTLFNDNIIVTSTAGQGVQFCTGNSTATVTQAAGKSISTGAAGFSSGTLYLRQFTQLGNTPSNLNLTGATTLMQSGPLSSFGGAFTVTSPRIQLTTTHYGDVVTLTKTGATGEWSYGGNTFNSDLIVNHLGAGYFGFASGAADTVNGDLYVNNNSTERILFGNNPVGNIYNGNIILTQIGSSQGIAFGWSATTSETQAAGKGISIGSAGFTTGWLQIERFTQLGNTPVILPLPGNCSLTFGPSSTIGGDMTCTSGTLLFNGCTFNGAVNATKTGGTSDASSGNNIFNGITTITNTGTGYLMLGNGNRDQFNAAATFNNMGSNNMYIAHNSPNNIFGDVTTFNNGPSTNNAIYISQNSPGTLFNDNIIVTSTAGQGIQFNGGSNAPTSTLATGKTISVGAAGFSAGTLYLRQFTQMGATPQNLTLTGTGNLTFGPASAFGGNMTSVSPTLFFNGCNFGGMVNSTKNGATGDASAGGNIFNGAFTVTNTGAGNFTMGNSNADLWQSTATFNNQSTAQSMYIAHNSTGNIFNGDVAYNNQPGVTGAWLYANMYGQNTQYNGNITVTNVNGAGVYFGNNTGSSVMTSGKSISVGAAGFNSGGLVFKNYKQSGGGTLQNLTTTGASSIQFGANASFDGPVTSSSPGLIFNTATFNGVVNCTKTGSTSDASPGNNIFNAAATFTNTGTGYLMMSNSAVDAYNSDVTFVQNGAGAVYPNYNINDTYAGNITVTSPSATAITFGAGNGTATCNGSALQNMNATSGTAIPVFTRLVIANTGAGVTLNTTSINVSKTLTMNAGLLNTTTTHILTMLNASTTAAGTALSTSYVNGPMRYQKSTSGGTTMNFPIGTAPDCRPIVLTIAHSNGTLYTYQAQLFDASARALGYTLPPTVTKVSAVHYYTIGRTDASGNNQPTAGLSGNQTIQIFFGANDTVSDGSALTIVKNTYSATTNWIDIGGAGGPAYNAGAFLTGSLTSTSAPTPFNSFSTFALGNKIGGNNLLPVKLLYFYAKPGNGGVDLTWATSAETNNSYFTVERSQDGSSFLPIQQVATEATNGNSSIQLDYAGHDASPFTGVSYYRLKQTDLDGHNTWSAIQSVDLEKQSLIKIYPNPASGPVYVSGLNTSLTSLNAGWYDTGGKLLFQEITAAQNGNATLHPHFNNGVYLLKLSFPDGSTHIQNVLIMH